MTRIPSTTRIDSDQAISTTSTTSTINPATVTSITLQENCRSVRDAFFIDWPDRHLWSIELKPSAAGSFKCLTTQNRIEFGHAHFHDRDALRATIMAFYSLARHHGRTDFAWEAQLRQLGGKASFIGRRWLALYLTKLATKVKDSNLPAIYIEPNRPTPDQTQEDIDLCFLQWPLASYAAPDGDQARDQLFEDSLRPSDFNAQLMKEAS